MEIEGCCHFQFRSKRYGVCFKTLTNMLNLKPPTYSITSYRFLFLLFRGNNEQNRPENGPNLMICSLGLLLSPLIPSSQTQIQPYGISLRAPFAIVETSHWYNMFSNGLDHDSEYIIIICIFIYITFILTYRFGQNHAFLALSRPT